MDSKIIELIADTLYSHESYRATREEKIEWIKRDLKTGKQLYSVGEIIQCIEAYLKNEKESITTIKRG